MSFWDSVRNLFNPKPKEYQPPTDVPVDQFPENNTGVIEGKRDTDFVAGKAGDSASKIPYEIVLPSGDWRQFVPVGEQQFFPNFDTMACVSYSNNNSAELQLKQSTGLEFNFSDRALSVLSETTKQGNYLYKVADVGRNIGRFLESDYPDDNPIPTSWDDYNKPLTPDLMKKAFRFNEAYQWVGTDKATLQKYLKQAPIQIIVNNGTHAVCLVYVDDSGYWYYDSYKEFLKKTTIAPSSALQIIVKPMTQFVHRKGTSEYGFYVPSPDIAAIKARGEQLGYPIVDSKGVVAWNKAKDIII